MHNAAVLRGRLVQVALENSEPRQFDAYAAAADSLIRKSLGCAPSDAFLWFALFWVENMRFGFRDESVKYLEQSYQFGPYEGWIALKRNIYALALYRSLPERLQKQAVLEFAAMVNSGFIGDAAANLQGPGWPIRDVLLASLSGAQEKYRKQFAVRLRRRGLELAVPGVEMPELRPGRSIKPALTILQGLLLSHGFFHSHRWNLSQTCSSRQEGRLVNGGGGVTPGREHVIAGQMGGISLLLLQTARTRPSEQLQLQPAWASVT
jgi:hypothetical protein